LRAAEVQRVLPRGDTAMFMHWIQAAAVMVPAPPQAGPGPISLNVKR